MQEIKVALNPSKEFMFVLTLMMLISIISIFSLPIFFGVRIILILSVLIYGSKIFWQYGFLQHKNSVIGLSFNAEGWHVHLPEKTLLAELCGGSTRTRLVSILRFKVAGERFKRSCVVWRDALAEENYRRLGVIAKWVKIKK